MSKLKKKVKSKIVISGGTGRFGNILKKVKSYNCKLVEVTGGEPLLQKNLFTKNPSSYHANLLLDKIHYMQILPLGSHPNSPIIEKLDFLDF